MRDNFLEARFDLALGALLALDPNFHPAFAFVWQNSLPRAGTAGERR